MLKQLDGSLSVSIAFDSWLGASPLANYQPTNQFAHSQSQWSYLAKKIELTPKKSSEWDSIAAISSYPKRQATWHQRTLTWEENKEFTKLQRRQRGHRQLKINLYFTLEFSEILFNLIMEHSIIFEEFDHFALLFYRRRQMQQGFELVSHLCKINSP